MYGEWLRVSRAELEHAKADLDWLRELAPTIQEQEYSGHESALPVAQRRSFGTDKTWQALSYLLYRYDFPVNMIGGEEYFGDYPGDPATEWHYGPPSYLTPEQVREAATALATLTEDDLIRDVNPSELAEAQIYPEVWDRPGQLEWAVCHLPHVRDYFTAAAKAGDAIVCWID
jgi:Domain of unknown function (DUF1877)